METILYPTTPDGALQRRRQRQQVLRAMLRELAQPLHLVRQAERRGKATAAEKIQQSVEFLKRQLEVAAARLARQLAALGVRHARRMIGKKTVSAARSAALAAGAGVTAWFHRLIASCRRCAARFCPLFQSARAIADRTGSRLAYALLRTFEKELWILQSNLTVPGRALARA